MFGTLAFQMRKSGGSIEFKTRMGTYGQVAFEMRHGMSRLGYIYLDSGMPPAADHIQLILITVPESGKPLAADHKPLSQ